MSRNSLSSGSVADMHHTASQVFRLQVQVKTRAALIDNQF
jgi:hypothetical protein